MNINHYWNKFSDLKKELNNISRSKLLYYNSMREIFWDCGLVNPFPSFDNNTIIISPIAATFHKL